LVPIPDLILTLPEVAELLKVAEKTVYTMAQKGELPAVNVRGQRRFERDDIDAWIERQKVVAVKGRAPMTSSASWTWLCARSMEGAIGY